MGLLEEIAFEKIDEVLPLLKNSVIVKEYKESRGVNFKDLTDGYHTYEELYYHRMKLTANLFNAYPEFAWKSHYHSDKTIWDGLFIVGVSIPGLGDYSYHYHTEFWDEFYNVTEIDFAPEYDGHTPEDIGRLDKLLDLRLKKINNI